MLKFFKMLLAVFPFLLSAQKQIEPKVDERVEIMSIAFRLAGAEEYSDPQNKNYVADIQQYFQPFENHALIQFIRDNRNEHGLGYDAVMSMALHLTFKNKKFRPVKEQENSLDKRWDKVDKEKFILLLNSFYKEAGFQKFFDAHQKAYSQAEKAYSESVLKDFNQNWYPKFYGKEASENYRIILGYANGGGNYGIKVHPEHEKQTVYAVAGVWNFDDSGNAVFSKNEFQPTLIHEFNHSFVNYILDTKDYKQQLEVPASGIYEAVKEDMKSQAYSNWITMINESIVRAAVVRYMMDNQYSQQDIDAEITEQRDRKFLWTQELVSLLGTYENNRAQYPALESFYPELVAFFKEVSENIDERVAVYELHQPKVKSLSPDIRNKQDADSSITELTVYFDREMSGKGVSISYGEKGKEYFPITKFDGYTEDNSGIKLQLSMKADTEYEFILTGLKLKSKEGYPLQRTSIKFKTK